MSSYIGQTPGSLQGDIRCNALYTQTLQSSARTLNLPIGITNVSLGGLGLEYKISGTLIITAKTNLLEYGSVLAYVSNNAIIATVTMMSSSGLTISSDGVNLQFLNGAASEMLCDLSMLWL